MSEGTVAVYQSRMLELRNSANEAILVEETDFAQCRPFPITSTGESILSIDGGARKALCYLGEMSILSMLSSI